MQCADSLLASWKIQRIATIGGNLAMALPAGPMTSLAVALDASLVLWTATGERTVRAVDFVTGVRTTVLRPGELIRAIESRFRAEHRVPAHRALAARTHRNPRDRLNGMPRAGSTSPSRAARPARAPCSPRTSTPDSRQSTTGTTTPTAPPTGAAR